MWHVLLVFSTIITVNNLDFLMFATRGLGIKLSYAHAHHVTPPTGVCIQTIWALTVTGLLWFFLVLQVGLCCDAYFLVVFLPDVFLDFLKYKSRFWSSIYVDINQRTKRVRVGGFGCLVAVIFFWHLFFLYVDCWDCWIMPKTKFWVFQFLYALSCFVYVQ